MARHDKDTMAETVLKQRARRFAGYAACTDCNALPNMPCREVGWAGTKVALDAPHPGRPKQEESR